MRKNLISSAKMKKCKGRIFSIYSFFLSFHWKLQKHLAQGSPAPKRLTDRHPLVMKNLSLKHHTVIITFLFFFKSIWYCGMSCTLPRLRFLQLHLYSLVCHACTSVTGRTFRVSDSIGWRVYSRLNKIKGTVISSHMSKAIHPGVIEMFKRTKMLWING